MRVRIALGFAVAAVLLGLALDASGRATRTAGSDHVTPLVFSATVPGGGVVCQPDAFLPEDAASVQVTIGTYGRPVPDLRLDVVDAAKEEVASGNLAPGAHEGVVSIPIRHVRSARESTSACLHVGGSSTVVLGGEGSPLQLGSEIVDGHPQVGRISLIYFRKGSESWWELLPTLIHRFGLGKSTLFGDWTLPFAALVLVGVWFAAIRLLLRELT
jgi:hypothetical protein